MGLILIRILFVCLGTLLGYYTSTQLYDQVGKLEGMAVGFGVAVLIILTEFLFRRVSLKVIVFPKPTTCRRFEIRFSQFAAASVACRRCASAPR
jgi:hypothetical protein